MRTKHRLIGAGLLAVSLCVAGAIGLSRSNFDMLNPAGVIAASQKNLLITVLLLMMLVVIPVFILTFYIAWKYRATNTKADYQPEWDHSSKLETLWWGFPTAIILVLAVLAWNTSHSLDPTRPLESAAKPLTIQVVALQWKWLFIYPEQKIASVNYVNFPEDRPVKFEITADAPMNSFWIPQLGGQIYAMAGMSTQLHLMADQPGSYRGVSANLSGEGFSDMHFTAESSTDSDFDSWVAATKQTSSKLSASAYNQLAEPAVAEANQLYASYDPGLYDSVLTKYMGQGTMIQGMKH